MKPPHKTRTPEHCQKPRLPRPEHRQAALPAERSVIIPGAMTPGNARRTGEDAQNTGPFVACPCIAVPMLSGYGSERENLRPN